MKDKPDSIRLEREYHPDGTNGRLIYDNWEIGKTIELPWLMNEPNISCIPEGLYKLTVYPSSKFGMVILVNDVPNRLGILFHPANYALKELRGCIAPVSTHAAPGIGYNSKIANDAFYKFVSNAIGRGASPYLEVASAGFPYEG